MKTSIVTKSLVLAIALAGLLSVSPGQAGNLFGTTERSSVRAASIARELNACEDSEARMSSRWKAALEKRYAALTSEMQLAGLPCEHQKPAAFRKLRNKGWIPAWRSW
ncbi:MAG: hypothetical protein O3C21_14790 [Verrucomicrobia bacterium]|nr:hypothetical protein [Verrucomicrobiota bacterium]